MTPEDALSGDATIGLESVGLECGQLIGTAWQFYAAGTMLCPYLLLLPTGRVGNYQHPNEHSWTVEDRRLVFRHELGRRTSSFDQVASDAHGRLTLDGQFLDGTHLRLQQVALVDRLADGDGIELTTNKPRSHRRNLVVIRAGEHSLHKSWLRDLADADRSWDLCVSFYGKTENFFTDDYAEFQILQNQTYKYDSLYSLMHAGSALWDYDFVTFPDDDLDMQWSDLNQIFAVCRDYGLDLAQPALHPESYINYPVSRQNKIFLLRYVSLVECMMPVFSQSALRKCVPTFALHKDGFGIDHAWARIIGTPPTKLAVIDKVAVRHTRPTGGAYDLAQKMLEGHNIAQQFNFNAPYRFMELGGIYASPNALRPLREFAAFLMNWSSDEDEP